MILVGIDIGKNKHTFSIIDKNSGEILLSPSDFSNNLKGFLFLIQKLSSYTKSELLIGMEDTGHYHFALLKYLPDRRYTVALINPTTTDLTRKLQGGITKNDPLDSLTICDVISSNHRNKPYRVTTLNRFDLYEQKQLTRHHHNLKEFNSLFHSKYGIVYMNILKAFSSAKAIANADIRSIRKCFEFKGQGKRISLSAEQLKLTAKSSIGIPSVAEEIQIRHLVSQIELLEKQLSEIDKRIEEFSLKNNSPILTIPGISHFSGTSIISELGDICNYTKASQIIKFAGVAPYHYESSQFTAQHTAITKKGSKYLRKTLYQIILPVISNNEVFYAYYTKKLNEGKGHRCAQGHCIRKLLRVIYHLLCTRQPFNPKLLV